MPVLWVGLPAVRCTKATSDMLFLDSLYHDAARNGGELEDAQGRWRAADR